VCDLLIFSHPSTFCSQTQKAQMVKMVRTNVRGAATLAIGDGANDVAMIQAAQVGCWHISYVGNPRSE